GFEIATPALAKYEKSLVSIPYSQGILGHYLLPGISTGEGLFVSVLQKTSQEHFPSNKRSARSPEFEQHDQRWAENLAAIPNESELFHLNAHEWHAVSNSEYVEGVDLKFKTIGLPFFQWKGKNCIPLHGLAMTERVKEKNPYSREESLSFLRKETLSLPPETNLGWQTVNFEQRTLGWIKVMENRTNNYYPSWLRLRK
ncbi:MAG: hypothetical protein WEC59_11590, partial [Salibacteraceae bacterium]